MPATRKLTQILDRKQTRMTTTFDFPDDDRRPQRGDGDEASHEPDLTDEEYVVHLRLIDAVQVFADAHCKDPEIFKAIFAAVRPRSVPRGKTPRAIAAREIWLYVRSLREKIPFKAILSDPDPRAQSNERSISEWVAWRFDPEFVNDDFIEAHERKS